MLKNVNKSGLKHLKAFLRRRCPVCIGNRFGPEKQAFITSELQGYLRSLSARCPVVVQLLSSH